MYIDYSKLRNGHGALLQADRELLIHPIGYAKAAYDSTGQKRKGTGEDYWLHAFRVMSLLNTHHEASVEMLQVALLHDVLEDVEEIRQETLLKHFSGRVVDGVVALTNVYTSWDYPELSRKQRKQLELGRLQGIDFEWKIVKLADICNNCRDVSKLDKKWAKRYLMEKEVLLELAFNVAKNTQLWKLAKEIILQQREILNAT